LSTIGFLALSGASDGADDAKKLAELQSIRSAATVELSKNRVYPIVSATTSTECARLDTANANLSDMKTQLSGFDLKNYVYCSNGDGSKFLVATDLNGKLPDEGFKLVTPRGTAGAAAASGAISTTAPSGTAGADGTATITVSCQIGGAASGTYCVGNL